MAHLPASWASRDILGGKAHGLSQLAELGFVVPPSFCITTGAFDEALSQVVGKISSLTELTEALEAFRFPDTWREQIARGLERIGPGPYAVRSSAIDEDSSDYSFAGQQLTVLHVETLDDVILAVREVWASLFDFNSLVYRENVGASLIPPGIAVVVQPMVEPVAAGVLFTSEPGDFESNSMLISAVAGLGTGVVDGDAPVCSYYIERGTRYIRHRDGEGSVLDASMIEQLCSVAAKVEAAFGPHQDIEFAFHHSDGAEHPQLVLLQSRPITHQAREVVDPVVWTNANVGEALPGVGTPMTWSIISRFSRQGFEQAFGSMGLSVPEEYELVSSFRGRVYLNLTQFMSIASAVPVMKPETLYEVAGGGGAELVKQTYTKRSSSRFLMRLPITAARVVASQVSMPWVSRWWERKFERNCAGFFERDLTRYNHAKLRSTLDEIDEIFDRNGLIMLASSSNFLLVYMIMREILGLWGGARAVEKERLLVSGLDVKSAEPGLALLELGRVARRSLRLRRIIEETPSDKIYETLRDERDKGDVARFLKLIDEFTDSYGHRAPREAELATPRWREDRAFLFDVIRGFTRSANLPTQRDVENERARRAREVHEHLEDTFGAVTRPLFKQFLEFVRASARRRELLRALVVNSLDMYRHYFLECARRLVTAGLLAEPEDVFFLTYEELRAWLDAPGSGLDYRLRVVLRRAIHEHNKSLPDPPNTFLQRGHEIIADDDHSSPAPTELDAQMQGVVTIQGLPGSSGRVTGRARVLSEPGQESLLAPGEVLVVPYADVGWTPLFLTASAVVMSLGGPLSHACIVAREYGIPTVVNARGAAQRIEDGDIVTVDGDAGLVFVRRDVSPGDESE